jgi:predicted transcriptional regulator of viral defense system
MQTLTEKVYHLNPPGGLFDSTVIVNLFPDLTVGARKLMVNRARRSGEVIRLRPGLYCLARPFRRAEPHPFVLAAAIHGPSHVSLETALAYHGLIPEVVHQMASVTVQRSRNFRTPMGWFAYYRVPSSAPRAGIKALELAKDEWAFVATPIRAMVDLVYLRKIRWAKDGMSFLTQSMRIEEEDLAELDLAALDEILAGIHSRRTEEYFMRLKKELISC